MELNSYKLGDCLSMIENGVTIKQKEGAEGYPITRIETLSNDRFNRDRVGYANVYDIDNYTNHILDDEDLIMSHINSRPFLGRTVIYQKKDNEVIIHGMNVLRIKTNRAVLNPFYAYYYFKTPHFRKAIDNIRTDAINQSSINTNNIKDITIHVPSISDQESVVETLRAIDKKIELNENINAELEAMAKQLYDYWFVQFDFPFDFAQGKPDENGKPYKSSGGKMVWNEKLKREIPEGWEVKEISEIAEIVNGATPLTSDNTNYGDDIVWITPYDLSNQKNKFILKGQRSISQKGYDSCSTTLLPKGSVLMSSRAPIGLLAIANTELCTNQGFKSFVPNDMEDSFYLYYYLQTNMPQIEQLGAGTTFREVSRDTMTHYSILYVNDRCLYREWAERIKPLFKIQASLEKEIVHLTRLRDSLLPMLMNGQATIE